MNERPLCVFVFLSLSVSQPVWAEDSQPLTLWFESPGTHWESEGLPIGNGALGAVLLGGVKTDRIQFNEKTLWTGGPGSIEGYDFGVPSDDGSYLVKNVREVLQKKSEMEPAAVAKILGRKTKGYGHYQNFGEVNIHFSSSKKIKNYRRELNLNEGIARVSYNEGGIHFVREYFCSYPDNVIVIRLSADKPKSINFSINYKIPNNRRVHSRVTSDGIIVEGALLDNGLTFATQLQLVTDGGVVQSGQVRLLSDKNDNSTDNTIEVSHADSAWLVLSAATNYEAKFPHYRGVDPLPLVQNRVDKAISKGYQSLLDSHQRDYQNLFSRVSLNLGKQVSSLATDKQLAA
ncbi:glycoside hydrolase family 95 protein, partial [bacterium AH-315-K03]|nr:glycoside hydrolase family 95 protein [bacterium AH-315-K03]